MEHTESQVSEYIKKMKPNSSMAEFIFSTLKGKFVEIYVGDTYETVDVEQISMATPAIFFGKVLGAFRECLIIDAVYMGKDSKPHLGNMIFINERAIMAITEASDMPNGSMGDLFLRSKDIPNIKTSF